MRRSLTAVEKYSRGRRGAPAKGVGRDNRRESSNLSFSANEIPECVSIQGFLLIRYFNSVYFLNCRNA